MNGTFSLMLHAHIPYCRKSGVWPAGEEWLFEAMHETYIPLLSVFKRFQQKKMKPRIMMGVVPILAEQLADQYMKDRFCAYMEDKIHRAEKDIVRFQSDEKKKHAAEYYRNYYQQTYDAFKNEFYYNILGSLKWLQEEKVIQILTSGATHGFLPLLDSDSSVYSQIELGVRTYEKYFGQRPKGIWLPECAYRPRIKGQDNQERRGIDEWLADQKIQFFFTEDIGITRAELIDNKYHENSPTTYRGYKLESGVCVFGRNTETGKQVWSPDQGYPGDPYYREFHMKDNESGIQYWRITRSDPKEIYDPEKAAESVRAQADHFVKLIQSKVKENQKIVKECPPIIMSPYDCELFGHWWHEGPSWIEEVYQRLLRTADIGVLSLDEYIQRNQDTFSTIRMKPCTWGLNGDFTVWQNQEHGWIWPYLNGTAKDMENVITNIQQNNVVIGDWENRILRQLGRELLLMQGSDWPFLLFTTQAKEYANQRFHHHHQRFNKLLWAAKDLRDYGRLNDHDLREMEDIDNPWPELDWKIFAKK